MDELHEAYDVDVAKLNRLAARSAERAEKLKAENAKLRELLKELYPFVGNACPSDCKHREECEGEGNRGAHGFPLVCVAYNRYFEELRDLGIEVQP